MVEIFVDHAVARQKAEELTKVTKVLENDLKEPAFKAGLPTVIKCIEAAFELETVLKTYRTLIREDQEDLLDFIDNHKWADQHPTL